MDYLYEIQLSSESHAVMHAISTAEGISGWWSKANTMWKENGDEFLSVDFGRIKKLMKVQRPDPLSRMTWDVLECTLSEWPGTQITFNLSPTHGGGTLLRLEHKGLTPELECFQSCSTGWEYFMASLKQYVETGKGTPY